MQRVAKTDATRCEEPHIAANAAENSTKIPHFKAFPASFCHLRMSKRHTCQSFERHNLLWHSSHSPVRKNRSKQPLPHPCAAPHDSRCSKESHKESIFRNSTTICQTQNVSRDSITDACAGGLTPSVERGASLRWQAVRPEARRTYSPCRAGRAGRRADSRHKDS